jgi:hypothetical protein
VRNIHQKDISTIRKRSLTKVIYEVDLLVTLVLQIRYCQVYE